MWVIVKRISYIVDFMDEDMRIYDFNSRSLLGRAIPLSTILEPVGDLGEREPGLLGQRLLLVGGGISVGQVAVLESVARLLLEAVDRLLAIPDRLGQGILLAQTVLVHGAQWSATHLLGLLVVGLEPEVLQVHVVLDRKAVRLQQVVQLVELAQIVGHHGAGPQDTLVGLEELAGRQAAEECGQLLDVALLLQCLAHALDLKKKFIALYVCKSLGYMGEVSYLIRGELQHLGIDRKAAHGGHVVGGCEIGYEVATTAGIAPQSAATSLQAGA